MTADEITRLLDEANATLGRLEAERDRILAYAAFLQRETTLKADFTRFTPLEAVDRVLKNAWVTESEASELGWETGQYRDLVACRDVVEELP